MASGKRALVIAMRILRLLTVAFAALATGTALFVLVTVVFVEQPADPGEFSGEVCAAIVDAAVLDPLPGHARPVYIERHISSLHWFLRKMTSAQIAEAQRMAREWKPTK